jgi:Uma2 family endonuclease
MTAVPKKPKFTEAEYLALERAAEYKSEYYDGEIFAMAGASLPHNFIKDNLVAAIGGQLKGGPCRTLSSAMRVKIPRARSYTYPDIVILCGKPELEDDRFDTLLNPTAIIEVLSPTTETFDRRGEFRRYQRMESLQEYVLVAQDEMLCERFVRGSDNSWVLTTFDDPAGEVALVTGPVRIPMAEIYRGVDLPEPPIR